MTATQTQYPGTNLTLALGDQNPRLTRRNSHAMSRVLRVSTGAMIASVQKRSVRKSAGTWGAPGRCGGGVFAVTSFLILMIAWLTSP